MKKSHCSLTCFMNISFFLFILTLVACASESINTVDPNVTPKTSTPSDHIKGTFSITQVTQASNNNLTQAYSNTKVTIAVKGSSLSFTVTNPPATNSVLSTGTATFDGASILVLTPASGKEINMELKPISADGFTATFTIADTQSARRGITGKWVMVFTKDKTDS